MSKNKLEIDKQTEHQSGHFFVSSVATWRTGRDLQELVRYMKTEKFPFGVYFVPVHKDTHYQIRDYAPQVEGAIAICTYGMDKANG